MYTLDLSIHSFNECHPIGSRPCSNQSACLQHCARRHRIAVRARRTTDEPCANNPFRTRIKLDLYLYVRMCVLFECAERSGTVGRVSSHNGVVVLHRRGDYVLGLFVSHRKCMRLRVPAVCRTDHRAFWPPCFDNIRAHYCQFTHTHGGVGG